MENRLESEVEPSASATAAERWTEVDGHRMRYLSGGSGPALVLVHGLLGYSFSWRHALPAFSQKNTVYALDMLGAGFSDRPPGLNYCFRAHAERLLQFLDGVGVASCDLLGTSHGGAVAMMTAALAPERIRSLILVAPANPWSVHGRRWAPFLSSTPVSWLILKLIPGLEIAHDQMLRRLYGDRSRIRPGTLEGYSEPFRTPGAFRYWLDVMKTWNRDMTELESAMRPIANIPTLLLWGGKDRAVDPASAEELSRRFSDCKSEIFEGVGHLPYEEVPSEFNSTVVKFLSRNERRAF